MAVDRRSLLSRATHSPAALGLAGLTAAGVVLAMALMAAPTATRPGDGPLGGGAGDGLADLGRTEPAAFRTFDSCDELLTYYRDNAARLVGPYGLPGGSGYGMPMVAEAARDAVGGAAAASPAPASQGATSDAGTNVQVAGVDEADIVKTDGDRVLTLTDSGNGPTLRVSRLGARGAVDVLGSLPLRGWYATGMLLEGDTALLVGPVDAGAVPDLASAPAAPGARMMPSRLAALTRLAEVDVSDPAAPRLVRTLDVDGTQVGVRLVDGVARVALTSSVLGVQWAVPEGDGLAAQRRATARNREIARATTLDNWLPSYVLTEGGSAQGQRDGIALDCRNVQAPQEFSGLDSLTLLSVDLRSTGVSRWTGGGVVATGSTLYATADHTYVATSPWVDWAALSQDQVRTERQRQRTQIHLFTTAGATAPRYVASGEVPGALVGQFAMDEFGGRLRVASTTDPGFEVAVPLTGGGTTDAPSGGTPGVLQPQTSSSQVTVLAVDGRRLVVTGRVGGLGRGEWIRSVRFTGATGYVVTFRQTDPLYVLDLSDPAAPAVSGELKIEGYSAYLHPLSGGLLLGVGQDADSRGRVKGTQMSLFDVSDPAAPRRLDQVRVAGAWSDAENDHHAFSYAGGLALAPFQAWDYPQPSADGTVVEGDGTFDTGVLAVPVGTGDLGRAGVLRPVADGPVPLDKLQGGDQQVVISATPLRTVVRDGVVYTVTARGIAAHDARTFDRLAFTPF
jgi:hypothetical protein